MNPYLPDLRVVIPAYNEPELLATVQSLYDCRREELVVEVIVVINSYRISPCEAVRLNEENYHQLLHFSHQHSDTRFRLTPILITDLPGHQTGAGLPRKIGMDQAAEAFFAQHQEQGIIVSLDADCRVEANYFSEIVHAFRKEKLNSCTIRFHHPTEHLPPDHPLRRATILYETYLHYYRAALEYIGFPYAYYTIGSAFAVTAATYRQVGGMGKQQAGEDFYFLHKVFPLGKTRFIDTTCVYPAARTSDRVPFGTGPVIARMLQENDFSKPTYQVAAFRELKTFFALIEQFFKAPTETIRQGLSTLPSHLQTFLAEDHFIERLANMNQHTASVETFRKRFFAYFTAFKILKYLNYLHPAIYPLSEVKREAERLEALRDK